MGQAQNPNHPESAATAGPTSPLNVNQGKRSEKHFRISLFFKSCYEKKKKNQIGESDSYSKEVKCLCISCSLGEDKNRTSLSTRKSACKHKVPIH